MFFRETILAHYQNHTQHNKPFGKQNAQFLTLKAGGTNRVTAEP